MFKEILVPLDRSALAERVLPHAVALATVFQSHVTLLHVLDPVHMTNYARAVDAFDWQMHRVEAEKYLAEMVVQLGRSGVEAEAIILEGEAAERVVEHSRIARSDLILLSSHGQSGLSDWNVSSVVHKIISRAYSSIMIVRAHQTVQSELTGLRYRRLLVPLDGSQRAECVLPQAELLARAHEAQALFVHVVQRPEMPRRTPLSPEDVELAQRIIDRNQTEAALYLHELASHLPQHTETRLLVKDNVQGALQELADQEKVDLVILSAHGYTGETRWPHGCVVTSFLSYGSTPLLIVQDVPQDALEPIESDQVGRQVEGK
jgi:nucleotide-binding universal stress UspA family protein